MKQKKKRIRYWARKLVSRQDKLKKVKENVRNGLKTNDYRNAVTRRCSESLQSGTPESNADTICEIESDFLVATQLASAGADFVERLASAEAGFANKLQTPMQVLAMKKGSMRALAIAAKKSMRALAIKQQESMRALAIKV